eukprot:4080998-Amphidinium_carterae.1
MKRRMTLADVASAVAEFDNDNAIESSRLSSKPKQALMSPLFNLHNHSPPNLVQPVAQSGSVCIVSVAS